MGRGSFRINTLFPLATRSHDLLFSTLSETLLMVANNPDFEDDYDGIGGVDAQIDAIRRDDPDGWDRVHFEGSSPARGCAIAVVFGLVFWTLVGFAGYHIWSWYVGT